MSTPIFIVHKGVKCYTTIMFAHIFLQQHVNLDVNIGLIVVFFMYK